MKTLLLTFTLGLSLSLSTIAATESCEAKDGKESYSSFCRGLNPFACNVHTNICELRKNSSKCSAKPGSEAHDPMCKTLDKSACDLHSNTCKWN